MRKHLLVLIAVTLAGTSLLAADWPQWRGPSLNGVSRETGLPTKWSATEGVAWKLPLPAFSGATPVIWNDLVFLNVATARATGSVELWAVDRNTHAPLWKQPMSDGNRMGNKQNMSSPSPVTDGRRVWAMTGTGVIKAFDFAGKELWMRDLPKEHGPFGLQFGYASSPLLHEGALYIQVLHGFFTDDASYVMKIDAASGKTLWRTERPTPALVESPDSYTTPALLQHDGITEIVTTGGDLVTAHDPATGKELWRADVLNPNRARNFRLISSPVASSSRRAASTRSSRCARAAPATSRRRTWRGRSIAGPTSRRPSAMAPTCISSAKRASSTRST